MVCSQSTNYMLTDCTCGRQANSTVHFSHENPVIYMTDGSSCPQAESMKASTAIEFICDTSIEEGESRTESLLILIASNINIPQENRSLLLNYLQKTTMHVLSSLNGERRCVYCHRRSSHNGSLTDDQYACAVPDRYAYWKTAVMVIVM